MIYPELYAPIAYVGRAIHTVEKPKSSSLATRCGSQEQSSTISKVKIDRVGD